MQTYGTQEVERVRARGVVWRVCVPKPMRWEAEPLGAESAEEKRYCKRYRKGEGLTRLPIAAQDCRSEMEPNSTKNIFEGGVFVG